MSSIPCDRNPKIQELIETYAEELRQAAPHIGSHGLSPKDFDESGLFRGAIERLRGQFAATMGPKREFVKTILNDLEARGEIAEWDSSGGENRYDYTVTLLDKDLSVIELKGCLDGNNTNIFERPPHANEFVIWSVCSNEGASPQHNVWSGIHTRLSAEIIHRKEQVDGLIAWDWVCGSTARPCPKLQMPGRENLVGPYRLPPPCIYLFPDTVPSPRNNPSPKPQKLNSVKILEILHRVYGGSENELNLVNFTAAQTKRDITRVTEITRDGTVKKISRPTPIKRA